MLVRYRLFGILRILPIEIGRKKLYNIKNYFCGGHENGNERFFHGTGF